MSERIIGDVSKLPTSGFRTHGLWFWAAMGFMGIEGAGFALACSAYIYLMSHAEQWPLYGRPPDLLWGTLQLVVMLASVPVTLVLSRVARRREKRPTQVW